MQHRLLLTLIFLFTIIGAQAQKLTHNGNPNAWFLWLNEAQIAKKWSLTTEFHYRDADMLKDPANFIFRPGLDYQLNSFLIFSGGYSFVKTWPHGPKEAAAQTDEHNWWLQTILKNQLGNVSVLHRFRQEVRYIENPAASEDMTLDKFNHANRFRYRLQLSMDKVLQIGEQKIGAVSFAELWLIQSDGLRPTDFGRNWFYVGLFTAVAPNTKLHLGFLDQFDRVSSTEFVQQPVLQLSLFTKFINLPNRSDVQID